MLFSCVDWPVQQAVQMRYQYAEGLLFICSLVLLVLLHRRDWLFSCTDLPRHLDQTGHAVTTAYHQLCMQFVASIKLAIIMS